MSKVAHVGEVEQTHRFDAWFEGGGFWDAIPHPCNIENRMKRHSQKINKIANFGQNETFVDCQHHCFMPSYVCFCSSRLITSPRATNQETSKQEFTSVPCREPFNKTTTIRFPPCFPPSVSSLFHPSRRAYSCSSSGTGPRCSKHLATTQHIKAKRGSKHLATHQSEARQ
jgi:hypothetical protein